MGIAQKTAPRRTRILLRAVLAAALLFAAALPALLFPPYTPLPTTGKYPVQTAVKYFVDESRPEIYRKDGRQRALAVECWYPQSATGSFPLLLFSHGAFGTRTSNETLFRELASHGYVVCSIDHTYQCLYTTRENGDLLLIDGGYLRELRHENAQKDKRNSLACYRAWMDVRVADIHFVIDTMQAQAKEDASGEFFRLANTKRIGVMGHSLGGSAALGIGRLRGDIGAVVALESPFLCDIRSVENDAFVFESAEYPVPVLNIYSDSSWPHLAQWPQYAKNAQLLSGSDQDAYSLHIAGTGHLSLTDLSLASPALTRILNGRRSFLSAEGSLLQLNESCLRFFDHFLKDAV